MTSPILDADRLLALTYVSVDCRPAVRALWNLDATLGAVLAGGREPMIGRIKLAWWRDALEGLDDGKAPAEPVLQAIAEYILPKGISGADLASMEEGWVCLLNQERLSTADLDAYAEGRGSRLFRHTAKLLGAPAGEEVGKGGEAWALVDLARRSADAADVDAALAAARGRAETSRWPGRLRPLGMLAALARRDAEPDRRRWEQQGAPGRMLRMFRLRMTGR